MPKDYSDLIEVEDVPKLIRKKGKVHIIPIGGCGEFGMNMTLYITPDQTFLVDAGVLFPDPKKLGLNGIMPKLDRLLRELGGLTAYVMTHGHMDHIGAMPFLLKKWRAPVICTPWTNALLEKKMAQTKLKEYYKPKVIQPGQSIVLGEVELLFFPVNHSIPDACSLVIEAEGRRIFHSGDFKFDSTPIGESPIDLVRLEEIGKEGVDVLIADSTGSQSEGDCPSEQITIEPLGELIKEARGRVFISTFSSNLWRIITILELAQKYNRRVFIDGRGFETTIDIAISLGRLKVDSDIFVSPEELSTVEDDEILIISTGSQGETRAALNRISYGDHRYFEPDVGDLFILSSRMIPGNERTIQHMIARLEKYGATVVTKKTNPNIHVSGHAYSGELESLLRLINPTYYLPVHGTHSQLIKNCQLGAKVAIPADNIFEVEDGQIYELSKDKIEIVGKFRLPVVYVDGDSNVLIEPEVYNRRHKIGELGGAIVSGVVSSETGEFIAGPEIELLGLSIPTKRKQKLSWEKQIAKDLKNKVDDGRDEMDGEEIREFCRIYIRRRLSDALYKKPAVISKIFIV